MTTLTETIGLTIADETALARTLTDRIKNGLERLGYPQPFVNSIRRRDIEAVVTNMCDEITAAFSVSETDAIVTVLSAVAYGKFRIKD